VIGLVEILTSKFQINSGFFKNLGSKHKTNRLKSTCQNLKANQSFKKPTMIS
jgi:hypothetical protein